MELLEARLAVTAISSDYAPEPGPFLLGSQLSIVDLYIRSPLADLFDYKQLEGILLSFTMNSRIFRLCYCSAHAPVTEGVQTALQGLSV